MGNDDLAYGPLESSLNSEDPYEAPAHPRGKVDGAIVGTVDVALPLTDHLDLAEFTLDILPEFQRQGVGRRLLEAAEHLARGEGRTMILVDTNHPGASLHEFSRPACPRIRQGFVPLPKAAKSSSPGRWATRCSTSSSSAPVPCHWTPSSWPTSGGGRGGEPRQVPPAPLDGPLPGPLAGSGGNAGEPGRR